MLWTVQQCKICLREAGTTLDALTFHVLLHQAHRAAQPTPHAQCSGGSNGRGLISSLHRHAETFSIMGWLTCANKQLLLAGWNHAGRAALRNQTTVLSNHRWHGSMLQRNNFVMMLTRLEAGVYRCKSIHAVFTCGSVVLVVVHRHSASLLQTMRMTVGSMTYAICTQAWHGKCICPASCVYAVNETHKDCLRVHTWWAACLRCSRTCRLVARFSRSASLL